LDDILIVTEGELRDVVRLNLESINIVEQAFRALGRGDVIMPPVLSMHLEQSNGEVDVKTAYIPGIDSFAIKVSPGFFNNPKIGLPSLSGLMIVFSAKTGVIRAVLLDNGYLTNIRTAAAGALATRYLAPDLVETVGVIGAGVQARLQIQAARLMRPFERVILWSPDRDLNEACAREIVAATGSKVSIARTAREVIAGSQLVITTTPATRPVLMVEWLHPGLHITCMGSDQETKNEIDPRILAAADLYVCDRVSQCERLGELRSARQAGLLSGITPPELGEIILGVRRGRQKTTDITVCDLTGTGAQDTAIASFALERARLAEVGMKHRR
jgi:ectoine utilization protein EutC